VVESAASRRGISVYVKNEVMPIDQLISCNSNFRAPSDLFRSHKNNKSPSVTFVASAARTTTLPDQESGVTRRKASITIDTLNFDIQIHYNIVLSSGALFCGSYRCVLSYFWHFLGVRTQVNLILAERVRGH
jgi:hypothetical protein